MHVNGCDLSKKYHITPFHSIKVLLTILTSVEVIIYQRLSIILNMTIYNQFYMVIMQKKTLMVPFKYHTVSFVQISYHFVHKGIHPYA